MKDYLFTRILEEVDKSGDKIILASATFEVVKGSTLDVHITGSAFETPEKTAKTLAPAVAFKTEDVHHYAEHHV